MPAPNHVPRNGTPRGASPWRTAFKALGVFFLVFFITAATGAAYLIGKFTGSKNPLDWWNKSREVASAWLDPQQYFPGQDRMTVLLLGLDRNYLISKDPKLNGMPYTKGSRSDVLMVASLDLRNHTVSILSVPRDTRVQLPGKNRYSKINQAHADGGVPYTRETVEQFLGVKIDHYVVIKQEAVQKIVDAVGGVKVKVAHDMDYEDHWGHLFIHLKEGEQVLNGEQAVGFMRFRHDEEGDFGRIRRQQLVIQTLGQKIKSDPTVLLKAGALIDAVHKYVDTDFSPNQQLALAHLFKKVEPGSMVTAQLPVAGTETINGISYVVPDEGRKAAAVDWVLRGNPNAMNQLVRVDLKNASGDRELYGKVYDCLRHYGFEVVRGGRASGDLLPTSKAVQRSNLKGAARRVLEVLGVRGAVERADDKSGADVTLYVGEDLGLSRVVSSPDVWPEVPERHATELASRHSHRDRRIQYDADVEIKPAAADEDEVKVEEPQMQVPGAAEPRDPKPVDTPGTAPAPAPDSGSTPQKGATDTGT